MNLLGSELCEVYGNSFVESLSKTEKKQKKKSKKCKRSKPYTKLDTVSDSLMNDFSGEMCSLVEGFANFEKKPEPTVEIVQPEQFEDDEENEASDLSELSEDEEPVYKVKHEKKRKAMNTKKAVVMEPKGKVQCEMDDMNDKIMDLDVKLNLLLEKLNKREDKNDTDSSKEQKSELGNIYDLILFVIFGIFFLLLLESISKVVVKNATKLNNVNPVVFNN